MQSVRIAISQINTIVGDLSGNTDKILSYIDRAIKKDADIIVFPELVITGYPPEDLLLKPHFIDKNLASLKHIAEASKDIITITGFVDKDKNFIYNSAGVLLNKKTVYVYHKMNLPNYGVFDEKRYFAPGKQNKVVRTKDFSFAVNICEDIWGPAEETSCSFSKEAQFLINISSSPYHLGKVKERREVLSDRVREFKIPLIYCNLIGGQDELIFDGRSEVVGKDGHVIAQLDGFKEDFLIMDLPIDTKKNGRSRSSGEFIHVDYGLKKKSVSLPKRNQITDMEQAEEVYSALMLGVRDYVKKNNFNKVTFGLSGGIDSALVASIAVDALGKENVLAISMPSQYSSQGTRSDAEKLAKNLDISFKEIPIDNALKAYLDTLSPYFLDKASDITEENIQARIRGNLLMAFSNKFGYLVLNTGNKSETSVGYCTLYGDMAGGFSVIKDVPKQLVYKLAEFVNKKNKKDIIPESILKRPPSAELRPGQKDQDSLPPYDLLDKIIDMYVERDAALDEIVSKLGNKEIVRKVLKMIDKNEYKRRQASPGIKITPRAFGKDRRMPITNKFTEA